MGHVRQIFFCKWSTPERGTSGIEFVKNKHSSPPSLCGWRQHPWWRPDNMLGCYTLGIFKFSTPILFFSFRFVITQLPHCSLLAKSPYPGNLLEGSMPGWRKVNLNEISFLLFTNSWSSANSLVGTLVSKSSSSSWASIITWTKDFG